MKLFNFIRDERKEMLNMVGIILKLRLTCSYLRRNHCGKAKKFGIIYSKITTDRREPTCHEFQRNR